MYSVHINDDNLKVRFSCYVELFIHYQTPLYVYCLWTLSVFVQRHYVLRSVEHGGDNEY